MLLRFAVFPLPLIVTLAVLGLQGCGSTPARADRVVCVREIAHVGNRITVTDKSPLGPWTEAEPYVITSLHGRSTHCPSAQLPITARAVPESVYAEMVAKPQGPKRDFPHLAKVEAGDVFPAGALHLATRTVKNVGGEESEAWLVINFEAASEKGEQSYVADVIAHCNSGGLSVAWWRTYRQTYGGGEIIASQARSPFLRIEKPSAALTAAVRAICVSAGRKR